MAGERPKANAKSRAEQYDLCVDITMFADRARKAGLGKTANALQQAAKAAGLEVASIRKAEARDAR